MIKINLLPVQKKKKKSKPLPPFAVAGVVIFLVTVVVMGYLAYFFQSKVSERQAVVAENERKLQDLANKIKSVEDYEKRNADFTKRKEVIEQLSKNRALPVKVMDEIATLLPQGVWLTAMTLNGMDLSLGCTGFNNTDVVNFVNSLKGSKLFSDVYLQESVQSQAGGFSVYTFRITCKVKG